MEWVETTGKTIDEAKEAALDTLGVDAQDAEFEVLAEEKLGLFGRIRTEARVRARVKPSTPRAKDDRRGRRRPSGSTASGAPASESAADDAQASPRRNPDRQSARGAGRSSTPSGGSGRRERASERSEGRAPMDEDVPLADQAEVGRAFLVGLLERFDADADVEVRPVDSDTIELAIEGDDLGVLIGPSGQTLSAIQELTRTTIQRRTSARNGWIVVDVAGYRRKRKEALQRFVESVADQAKSEGVRKVLEPMSPADRKIVHDTVNGIDGVTTVSEGEEPRRRVVLQPE